MSSHSLKKIKYDSKEVQVESAIRDGSGKEIATYYQPKDTKLTSISGLSNSSTGFVKLTNGTASVESSTADLSVPNYHLNAYDTVSGNTITRKTGYLNKPSLYSTPSSYTNCIYYKILKPSDAYDYGAYTNNIKANIPTYTGSNWDSTECIGKIAYAASSGNWWVGFATGTTEAQAQAFFNTIQIQYLLKTDYQYTEDIIANRPLSTLDLTGEQWLRKEWEKGLQLWDEQWSVGGIVANALNSKNYIPVKPNTKYWYSCSNQNGNCVMFFYDSSKTQLSSQGVNNTYFITPSNCYYIRFRLNLDYGTTYNHDIMLNEGDHPYPYSAYKGEIVRPNNENYFIDVQHIYADSIAPLRLQANDTAQCYLKFSGTASGAETEFGYFGFNSSKQPLAFYNSHSHVIALKDVDNEFTTRQKINYADSDTPLRINTTQSGATGCYIGLQKSGTNLGYYGFTTSNVPVANYGGSDHNIALKDVDNAFSAQQSIYSTANNSPLRVYASSSQTHDYISFGFGNNTIDGQLGIRKSDYSLIYHDVHDNYTAKAIAFKRDVYNCGVYDEVVDNGDGTTTITRKTGYLTITKDNIVSTTPETSGGTSVKYVATNITMRDVDNSVSTAAVVGKCNVSGYTVNRNGDYWARPKAVNITQNENVSISNSSYTTVDQFKADCPFVVEYQLATAYQHTEKVITNQPLNVLDQAGSDWLRKEWEAQLNLFDGTFEDGYINTSTGNNETSSSYIRPVGFISAKPNTTYTLSNGTANPLVALYYTSAKAYISYKSGSGGIDTFTTPDNCYFVRFYSQKLTSNKIMLVEGSRAYPYKPYQGKVCREDVLLWSSTATSRGSGGINLAQPASNFKYIKIGFRPYMTQSTTTTVGFITYMTFMVNDQIHGSLYAPAVFGSQKYYVFRDFGFTTSSMSYLYFYDGNYAVYGGTTIYSPSNGSCVPVEIWGSNHL